MEKSEYDVINEDAERRILNHKKIIGESYDKYISINRKCMNYACNEQWRPQDKQKAAPRPCLTFNELRAMINLVSGYDWQQKTDIKFVGVEGDDGWFADMYTRIVKYINDKNKMEYLSNQSFQESLISSSSFFEPSICHRKDMVNGEVKVNIGFFDEIFFDPSSRLYDNSDAAWCNKAMLLSKYELIQMFPKKKKDIKEMVLADDDNDLFTSKSYIYNERTNAYGILDGSGNLANFANANDSLFLYEDWYYKTTKVKELYDYANQEITDISKKSLSKEDREIIEREGVTFEQEQMGLFNQLEDGRKARFEIRERETSIPWVAHMVGNEVMEEKQSPYYPFVDTIPIVPVRSFFMPAARKMHMKYQGMIESLIDAQNEINLRSSQILHIINTIGNTLWLYDDDAFTPQEEANFRVTNNVPGMSYKKKNGSTVQRIASDPNLANLFNLWNLSSDYLKKISGVNPAFMTGEDTGDKSGKALALIQGQGVISIMGPNKNKELSRKNLTEMQLGIALQNFSDEKIMKIVGERNISKQEVQLLRDGFKNLDYDIAMSQIPLSPAIRQMYAEQITNYAKEGLLRWNIVEDLVVDGLDLPFADEYKKRLTEVKQQEAQMQLQGQNPMGSMPMGGQKGPMTVNQ